MHHPAERWSVADCFADGVSNGHGESVADAHGVAITIALTQRFAAEMLPLFDSGALRPVIDSRFPFDQIADAHRHMAANANAGKIMIDVG